MFLSASLSKHLASLTPAIAFVPFKSLLQNQASTLHLSWVFISSFWFKLFVFLMDWVKSIGFRYKLLLKSSFSARLIEAKHLYTYIYISFVDFTKPWF